jgi:hypothetical protein
VSPLFGRYTYTMAQDQENEEAVRRDYGKCDAHMIMITLTGNACAAAIRSPSRSACPTSSALDGACYR